MNSGIKFDDTLQRLEPDIINLDYLKASSGDMQQFAVTITALISMAISLKRIADNSDRALLELRQLQTDVHKIKRQIVGK